MVKQPINKKFISSKFPSDWQMQWWCGIEHHTIPHNSIEQIVSIRHVNLSLVRFIKEDLQNFLYSKLIIFVGDLLLPHNLRLATPICPFWNKQTEIILCNLCAKCH